MAKLILQIGKTYGRYDEGLQQLLAERRFITTQKMDRKGDPR